MFACPICNKDLIKWEKSLVCSNNHCFDYARQGYINLLPVQQKKSLCPGDTREMLTARRNFLSKGYYDPILERIEEYIKDFSEDAETYVDCGCGEGWYTKGVADRFSFKNVVGTDIAKDAVKMCCNRSRDINWVVATASHLPLNSDFVDVITAVFSLVVPKEYHRVLKKGGIIVEVSAGNNHLVELKEQIYDKVFLQDKHQENVDDLFETVEKGYIDFSISLKGEDLYNLLVMTPHFHRIKREKKEKLFNIHQLNLTVDCNVRVLKKR